VQQCRFSNAWGWSRNQARFFKSNPINFSVPSNISEINEVAIIPARPPIF
jgi:hypothetical protein